MSVLSITPDSDAAIVTVRQLFLREDNHFGCAETTLVALHQHYDLKNAEDSSLAMAFNGGVAYSGGHQTHDLHGTDRVLGHPALGNR